MHARRARIVPRGRRAGVPRANRSAQAPRASAARVTRASMMKKLLREVATVVVLRGTPRPAHVSGYATSGATSGGNNGDAKCGRDS